MKQVQKNVTITIMFLLDVPNRDQIQIQTMMIMLTNILILMTMGATVQKRKRHLLFYLNLYRFHKTVVSSFSQSISICNGFSICVWRWNQFFAERSEAM